MKWLKRAGLTLLSLIVLVLLYALGVNLYEANFSTPSSSLTNVTFPARDGTKLHGYLAEPQDPGPHPAVLLIHEWWGLNESITILADALSAEGYLVLAADAYRGEVTDQVARAIVLRTSIPEEQIFSDLDAALDFLYSLKQVDTGRIAAWGFCFGGGQSLRLGLRDSDRLSLTIMYYGDLVTDPELLKPLKDAAPLFGVFGEKDQTISPAEVLEFEATLNSLDIPNEITIYPGVGHAFLSEDNYNQPGAAMDAWQATLAFLDRELGD